MIFGQQAQLNARCQNYISQDCLLHQLLWYVVPGLPGLLHPIITASLFSMIFFIQCPLGVAGRTSRTGLASCTQPYPKELTSCQCLHHLARAIQGILCSSGWTLLLRLNQSFVCGFQVIPSAFSYKLRYFLFSFFFQLLNVAVKTLGSKHN